MKFLIIEFKQRMKIFHDSEDEEIERLLKSSMMAIKRMVGSDDTDNESIKELVFERSRYAYNDSLEYFEDNFQSIITGLMLEEIGNEK